MSTLIVKRFIDNLTERTTVYSPIIEAIVNSIQSIQQKQVEDGLIVIKIVRNLQNTLDESNSDVIGFIIEDNGIGFNESNLLSFDTAFSELKKSVGCKGIGRFTYIKYFENISINSIYKDNSNQYKQINFEFNLDGNNEIISNKVIVDPTLHSEKTIITMKNLRSGKQITERGLDTISKSIVERLLIYFIDKESKIPKIIVSDENGETRLLNDFCNSDNSKIILIGSDPFTICNENFEVKIFKIFSPKNQNNKICLTAHKIEVEEILLSTYEKAFSDQFYDQDNANKNFILKAYITSDFLDKKVSLERSKFDLAESNDELFNNEISKKQIYQEATKIISKYLTSEIKSRLEKRKNRIKEFTDKNIWYKSYENMIDLDSLPINPDDDTLDEKFNSISYQEKKVVNKEINELLYKSQFDYDKSIEEIFAKVSDQQKNDIAKYISTRRVMISILEKALQIGENEKYNKESIIHSIIFPLKSETINTKLQDHNLWIIDERLNFSDYVLSDIPLNGSRTERPDILLYNNKIMFREDNQPHNPVTIFEFKKPGRDDFANPSSSEDPIEQLKRYRNSIADGNFKTPKGRKINIESNTPYYGYIICDINPKVSEWLERMKGCKVMPDGDGWFKWEDNINLYIEIISWDKLLRDAKKRNMIFFEKLNMHE